MTGTKEFHVDDVVALKRSDNAAVDAVGYIDRTYGDVESHEPHPAGSYAMKIHRSKSLSRVAFKKFLQDGVPPKGFVLVQWQTHPRTELVAEKDLDLLDRNFLAGDVIRRDDPNNQMAGTIISVRKNCTLLGMCEAKELKSGKSMRAAWLPAPVDDEPPLLELVKEGPVLHDIPAKELKFVHQYNEGDLIIYKNWLGRVRECFDEITVRLSDNGVVTLQDENDVDPLNGDPSERLSVGSLIKTKKGKLRTGRWVYGAYNPNVTPVGVVVGVNTQECQVDWLQGKPSQDAENRWTSQMAPMPTVMLDKDDLESGNVHIYDLTKRTYDSIPGDTRVASDIELQGGLRVMFKDIAGASVKYDGSTPHGKLERLSRTDTLGYDMNVYTVMNTQTKVDVQWNDLTITEEFATSLAPDFAVDDEDVVFPGDLVCTNEQKPDGVDGTIKPARVGIVQGVNNTDRIANIRWCEGHSLSFLETTLTTLIPRTTMGRPLEAIEEVSFYDIKGPESINRRRGDFVLLLEDPKIQHTSGDIHWVGEVVDVKLDGKVVIRLGAANPVQEVEIPTESTVLAFRSTDLDDIAAEGSDIDDDAMSFLSQSDGLAMLDDEDYEMDDDDLAQWYVAGHPEMPVDDEDDAWSTASEDDDIVDGTEEMDTDIPNVTDSQVSIPAEIVAKTPTTDESVLSQSIPTEASMTTIEEMNLSTIPDALPPYDVLETEIPPNHPFAHRVAASSSIHMKAMQKEHKILSNVSNLPSGIYVRTWESRLDLIRVLFIGPVGTPYEYAPFVVDLFLGASFPAEPPLTHFHSWASEGSGMQGRVNPNLYEDGKICLSLLGTWQGDDAKGEGWVSGKSTILQILVSILGLVLVKEPYFSGFSGNSEILSNKANQILQTKQGMSRYKDFYHPSSQARCTLSEHIYAPELSSSLH